MNKRDLAHVLVKLCGFSWLLWSLFTGINHIISSIGFMGSGSTISSALQRTLIAGLLTTLIQIVLALVIIRNAAAIAEWMFGDEET